MNEGPVVAVGAVVIQDGRLLVVKRANPPEAGRWAVPGGKVRFGESLRAGAARETREETGLEVEVGEVVWAGESIGPGDPPGWHYTLVDLLAEVVGGELSAGEDAAEVAWIGLEDLGRYALASNMPALISRVGHRLGVDTDGRTTT